MKNPDSEITGREAYMKTVEKLMPLLEGVNVRAKFGSGNQVMLAYDFYLSEPVKVSSVANLMTVQDGLVRSVELFMDFRPFSQHTPQERQKKSA